MSTEAREAKKALRNSIKQRLATLSEDEVSKQSEAAQNLIISLPQYRRAQSLSIYLSMPTGEARTDLILRDALSSGKRVFVPHICSPQKGVKRKNMDMLRLKSLEEFEGLERDSWGIPTLLAETITERENAMGGQGPSGGTDSAVGEGGLDLVVVPGVAFDAEGSRMGHGAGFYDGYLTRFCNGGQRQKPFLVGLCLAEQLLSQGEILMQEWDWNVDAVAVGDGQLLVQSEAPTVY